MSLAVFGSYGLTGSMAGPYTVLVFSVLGYVMKKYDYSVPGLVIGILLGKMAESELLHSYQISGGTFSYIFTRPMTLVIVAFLLFSILYQPIMKFIKAKIDKNKIVQDES